MLRIYAEALDRLRVRLNVYLVLFLLTVCVIKATIVGVTNGSVVDADTVIRCVADENAYPLASYRWINHVDGNQSAGQEFTLRRNTQYKLTCNASNHFDIPGCYATDYVEVNSKLLTLYSLTSAHEQSLIRVYVIA